MNETLKKVAKPLVHLGFTVIEQVVGFKTDPTGYEPPRMRMLIGTYEKFLITSILDKMQEKGIFIDVGANVGYISKEIAKARPRATKIFSVEPNPRLKKILQRNLRRFHCCEIMNCGLGSKEDILEFYEGKESALGSFVKGYNEAFMSHIDYKVNSVKVPVKRGDELFEEISIIDVMKVDVEGFELEVLMGFSNLLSKGVIKNIFFEIQTLSQSLSGSPAKDLIKYLKKFNYTIVGIEEHWKGVVIDDLNIDSLSKELGEKGYTTLLATLSDKL